MDLVRRAGLEPAAAEGMNLGLFRLSYRPIRPGPEAG